MKVRRPVALLVACWFAFLSAWMPHQAWAFVPPVVALAPVIKTAAGTVPIVSSGAGATLASLIGLAAMYLIVEDATQNKIQVPLGPNANNQPPLPAAAPTAPQGTEYASTLGGSWSASPNAAMQSYFAAGGCGSGYSCAITSCTSTSCQFTKTWTATGQVYNFTSGIVTRTGGCPPGYTLSGSTCNVTNPRLVTDDRTCDILFSTGQFATANDMNCGSSVDGTKIAPMFRDGKVLAYGKNSSGQPLLFEVVPQTQSQQAWRMVMREQVQTATQTQVKTTELQIDPQTSTITSASTRTEPGSLASPSASTVPTSTDPQTQPTTSENTPTVQTRTGEQVIPEFQFPSDYAREPTVQQIKDALTQQSTPATDPESRTGTEIGDQFFKNTFDTLKGWSLPGHSSQCPTGSFDALGSTHVIDAHCTLINNHWGVLQAAMIVVWSIAALWIVLRA